MSGPYLWPAERFRADTHRRFGSLDPRDITLPHQEVSGDRSRMKARDIGQSP